MSYLNVGQLKKKIAPTPLVTGSGPCKYFMQTVFFHFLYNLSRFID